MLNTHCGADPAHFPFDYQICNFKVGSQVYSTSDVVIDIVSTTIDKEQESNPTWRLVDIKAKTTPYEYQEVCFCLQRKSLYLSVLYMAPTTMLAVLVLISYVIPCEAGEKISFGMSLFLSFMVCLLQLHEHLPQVSTSVPALSMFCCQKLSSMCTFDLNVIPGVIYLAIT
jgi:hypothetical protein